MSTMCKSAIYNVAEFYELFSLDEITNKGRVYSREWVALHVIKCCKDYEGQGELEGGRNWLEKLKSKFRSIHNLMKKAPFF